MREITPVGESTAHAARYRAPHTTTAAPMCSGTAVVEKECGAGQPTATEGSPSPTSSPISSAMRMASSIRVSTI